MFRHPEKTVVFYGSGEGILQEIIILSRQEERNTWGQERKILVILKGNFS